MNRIPEAFGISFLGPVSILKGKKLALTRDFFYFLARVMKSYHGKSVAITVNSVVLSKDSISDFIDGLCKPPVLPHPKNRRRKLT